MRLLPSRTSARKQARHLAVAATALAALVGTAGSACADDAAAPLPAGTKITVTGHGWGHGHGMSQYGARGAALAHKSADQIAAFYYPGTRSGKVGGQMRVLVTADTSPDVVVQQRSGLVARAVRTGRTWNLLKLHPKATRFKLVPATGGRTALAYLTGSWHRMAVVKGDMSFYAKGAPIRLFLPHGSKTYRGTLRSSAPTPGKWDRNTVNILALDSYLKGVVPSEMPASWPQAAVRAQAIAARSYAAYSRAHDRRGYFDVYDTTADQVYGGYSAEDSRSNAAVTATAGKVRLWKGAPAFTQFSSSNGGYMLAGSQPYLVSKADPYEAGSGNPKANWTKGLTLKQLSARFPSVGKITGISVSAWVPGTGNRYAKTVRVEGVNAKGEAKHDDVSADTFRSWAGLNSTYFSIKVG